MKIRKGFISNSSSTSFICEVCAETVSGWDVGLEEAEMYKCENGHIFCKDHAINGEELEEMLNKLAEGSEDTDDYCDAIHEILAKHCPCCTFTTVSPYDLTDYLLKKVGMDTEAVAKELRDKFIDFGAFRDYIEKE